MGRRRKCRFVADVPEVTVFKPQGVPMSQLYGVVIALDGFEALRLVDAEGLSQEEAAERMRVSRPTLCRILGEARGQVARALSRGWAIRIEVDVLHAATEGRECRKHEAAGHPMPGCGAGPRGGRSCRDREDKVAEGAARAAAAEAREQAGVPDGAAVAGDGGREPKRES